MVDTGVFLGEWGGRQSGMECRVRVKIVIHDCQNSHTTTSFNTHRGVWWAAASPSECMVGANKGRVRLGLCMVVWNKEDKVVRSHVFVCVCTEDTHMFNKFVSPMQLLTREI